MRVGALDMRELPLPTHMSFVSNAALQRYVCRTMPQFLATHRLIT